MINKYLAGGAAPQDQQARIQLAIMLISQATGEQPETIVAALKNGKDNFKKVLEALQQGNVQAAKQMIQQLAGKPMARLGAKLNYIRSLKGACPEGQEVKYFKQGGQMKCKCVDKAAGGEKVKDGKKEIADFKKKKACGGLKAKFQPGGKARTKAQQKEIDRQSEEDAINGTYGLNKNQINKVNNPKQKTETRGGLKRTITYKEPVEKNDTTFTRNNKVSSNNFGDRNKFKKDEKEFKAKKHFYGGSLNCIPFIKMGL